MKVPSLVKDPPNHRHRLAVPYFGLSFNSVLDVGGIAFKHINGRWMRSIGPPKDVWGVTHILDKKTKRPHIFTINVTRDYEHKDRKPDMYYDGLHIPFADSSYDIVTSIDVLEHIPKKERAQVLSEMIRVAKCKLIIVFPFFSQENKKMEEEFLDIMKRNNIQPRPSTTEHRQFELPKISDIERILKEKKVIYTLNYGTSRSVMKQYYLFQISINSLLNIPNASKNYIFNFMQIIMNAAGNMFDLPKIVKRKDAYRAIVSITK